jgi:hypothetical protein
MHVMHVLLNLVMNNTQVRQRLITCLEMNFFTFMSEIWHVIMSYLCRGNKFYA